MPLPLLVPIALGIAGLVGAGKTVKAAVENSKANSIAKDAAARVQDAEDELSLLKRKCNGILQSYGKRKLGALQKELQEFVELFSQLRNVDLAHSPELDRLQVGQFTEVTLKELTHSCSFASSFATSTAAGAGAGALTAFGAYGGTMMLASASTGTAIGTLSGAAATNATLAWLGGGTLAAGGYGVAGGTMVLGVMVAGPAMLVLGSVLGARASKKLDEARINLEKAQTYETEVAGVCDKLKAIIEVTIVASDLLRALRKRLAEANGALMRCIETSGTDYTAYDEAAKNAVFRAVKLAQLVKKVLDTPILQEDGSLSPTAMIGYQEIKGALD